MILPQYSNSHINKCVDIITLFYDGKCAKRSKVPYMNHIVEGAAIISHRNAYDAKALCGYMLHPLVQADEDLRKNLPILIRLEVPSEYIALAIEYRKTANAYLSHRKIKNINEIELSPLTDVNEMLIADKVQNKKDFMIYHKGSHPRSNELEEYFNNWLDRLGVTDKMYSEYVKIMGALDR